MDSNGYCEQCPQKCFWDFHQNTPYIFYLERKPVKKTFDDVKAALEKALGKSLSLQQVIAELDKNLQKLEEDIEHLLSTVNTCNNELQRIALRPNSLTIVEHIELMIKSEEKEKRTGFKERIDELELYKEKAQFAKKLDDFKKEKENVGKEKTSASNSLKRMMSGISVTVTTKVEALFK
jgi:chromosome segregation ATPase